MKCPICGKQTLPGAKLCSPCRAALKRAKDDSVWELPPSQRPGEPAPSEPSSAEWVLGAPRLTGWRSWALAAGGLVVCAGVALHFMRSSDTAPVAASTGITVPAARSPVSEPAPVALPRAIPASTQPPAPEPAASHLPAAEPHVVQPPRTAEHPVPARAKPKAAPEVVAPPVFAPAEAAPPPLVAVAPPPPPARPVDPWQRLNDALARCGTQDFFGRVGCEYRARATHCEGHWGEVAQCPAGTSNDHGQ